MKITLVIPTRNRSALAMEAIRSLLGQEGCALEVVVSDNSSSEDDVRRLAEFCGASGHARLHYVRPPHAMGHAPHWDWALEQAMARTGGTHFGIHYDRKLWKPRSLRFLCAAAERFPDDVITYSCDTVFTNGRVVHATHSPATGRLYAIETAQVVRMAAAGAVRDMDTLFPHLLNCITPRPVLERIRAQFGSICDSTGPDAAFAFRLCAAAERYLHLDRSLVVVYAFGVSNGWAYLRRDAGSTTLRDYLQLNAGRLSLDAAPIPGLMLGQNVLFHEYGLVQRVAGTERFPPIDREGYLRELAFGLTLVEDPAVRAELRAVLERHGWREEERPRRTLPRRIAARIARMLRRTPRSRRFASEEEAVRYLLESPPRLQAHNPVLARYRPVEIPA